MKKFLHIVQNDLKHDSRVIRELECISNEYSKTHETIAIGYEPGNKSTDNKIPGVDQKNITLFLTFLPKFILFGALKRFEYFLRVLVNGYHKNIDVIHCHDLPPLMASVVLKKLTGARLIYDAHELETETGESSGLRLKVLKYSEKFLLKYVDVMITVSPSIKSWYQKRNPGLEVYLVRNTPKKCCKLSPKIDLKRRLNITEDSILFVYTGRLTHGRGIENILLSFMDDSISHHVVFIGEGPLKEQILNASKTSERVHFHPYVLPEELISLVSGADIGLSLIEDVCLSYRYCLPNKLFEGFQAGLPMVVSNLPDQAEIVRKYQAGWVTEMDTTSIKKFLHELEYHDLQHKKEGLSERVNQLDWEHEQQTLKQAYKSILAGK